MRAKRLLNLALILFCYSPASAFHHAAFGLWCRQDLASRTGISRRLEFPNSRPKGIIIKRMIAYPPPFYGD